MAIKILNIYANGSPVILEDLDSIVVPVGSGNKIDIAQIFEPMEIVTSDDLEIQVGAGNLTVNDGTQDLSIDDGLVYIKLMPSHKHNSDSILLSVNDLVDTEIGTDVAEGDCLQFLNGNWVNLPCSEGGSGDHGDLTGLLDDDHPQYHNNARGDARYYTETELDSGQLDNRYYTESEVNSLLDAQDELSELDDVSLSGISDDDILVYDSGSWVNTPLQVNDIIHVFDCCSDQAFANEVTKSFDTTVENSNTSLFSFSDANDEITINGTGLFLIGFEISTDVSSGSNRSVSYAYLQVDTGGGYSPVYGTTAWMYNRTSSRGANTGAMVFPYQVTSSGTKFRVRLNQDSGSSSLYTPQDSSRFWIMKLK